MWVWVVVLLICSAPAQAQDRGRGRGRDRGQQRDRGADLAETAPAPPEAREAYQAGLEAMENGRWADALEAFQRSYEIFPAATALFNQGVVLRSLGRLRDARDTFARLLDDHPDMSEEARNAANEMGAEVAERIAAIEIENLPRASSSLRLRFDGDPLEDEGSRPLLLEVDPGEHSLAVLAEGYEPFEWRDTLADGETGRVRVDLERTGIPFWVWLAAGGGLVIGAVVVIALLASQESSETRLDPIPGFQ